MHPSRSGKNVSKIVTGSVLCLRVMVPVVVLAEEMSLRLRERLPSFDLGAGRLATVPDREFIRRADHASA